MTGVLRHWSQRQFGFVRTTSSQGIYTDYFLHISNLKSGKPFVGSLVEFTPASTQKGQIAVDAFVSALPAEIVALSGGN